MKKAAIFTFLCASLACASLAYAREHQAPQSGTILQMDSVQCGTDQKSDKSLAGEIIGTDNADRKTHTLLCQEYVLQTDRVTYRIRPKDDKHAALLPLGGTAQFHVEKDYLKLRVEGLDGKEREYVVVTMTPRAASETADNRK